MRSSCCCASVTWVCCCARFAFASSSARCAWLTSASDFFSEASRSRVSISATTWPAATMSPSIDKELRDPAGELGVDVDFVGFEAAISGGDAGRQPRLMLLPPDQPMPAARADQQQQR